MIGWVANYGKYSTIQVQLAQISSIQSVLFILM